ncbi:hypothetical protein IW261DRAFT_1597655 [Armillaria novae-zelandiae]|uniref:Uncharacterized protein n=1 Tax=Armillaria novae-zelandiae TaxID=153914 RepID=A0AA39NS34_9AGAR|nr:hypothetical protein IW261DRAFT_1597655 [Armillaria novae-zelandiae]
MLIAATAVPQSLLGSLVLHWSLGGSIVFDYFIIGAKKRFHRETLIQESTFAIKRESTRKEERPRCHVLHQLVTQHHSPSLSVICNILPPLRLHDITRRTPTLRQDAAEFLITQNTTPIFKHRVIRTEEITR